MIDPEANGNARPDTATTARSGETPKVLKHGETFAMFDRFGDVPGAAGEHGVYHEDTRFLSRFELRIERQRPLWLNATVKEANSLLTIDLTNPPLDGIAMGTLHVFRGKLLWNGACYEHVRIANHGAHPVQVTIEIAFDADFADVFEVRGQRRERSGERLPEAREGADVVRSCRGLDGRLRRTRLLFDPAPERFSPGLCEFDVALAPGEDRHLYCTTVCEVHAEEGLPLARPVHYDGALRSTNAERQAARSSNCRLETSNPLVNLWLERSLGDLAMLTTVLPTGPFPYAGLPWHSTTIARDGIVAAREMLWIDPLVARGVLEFLASTQSHETDAASLAQPGKILHEARRSEMARTGEVPFARWFGSVDATPLFVGLAGAHFARTGDIAFARSMWPNVLAALEWIDRCGDADGDGFVEYPIDSRPGVAHAGWRNAPDAIFHRDGRPAAGPIALCEVQGYVYEARLMAAFIADHLGDATCASRLRREAHVLQQRFDEAFWCDEVGSYAIALDGRKNACRVRASSAGHLLWSGIAPPERAARVASNMLGPDYHNGWGIRTVADGQALYNPMSLHNGSVWPHDNALIASGMARYGHTAQATRVLTGLYEASLHVDEHRLPQLFCGFHRRDSEGPVLHPTACTPHASAAGAAFALLQACLGLDVDATSHTVSLRTPHLPPFIDWLRIQRLQVGTGSVDLLIQRYANNVGVEAVRKEGDVEVVVAF